MTEQSIHLVFKTHLDIGFTDHAEKVRRLYHERFIPQAIDTGEHFFGEDPTHPMFIWTTGAWLIWDHLEHAGADKARRLERAIERGLIRWHALPFTTHSELMSPSLFEAGLSYSADLDSRFGKHTIAAKMTDVPGHTRGIVPLLAKAGVRFLHLGVNAASPLPDVPEIFRWRAPAGEEILVMYQDSYGATHFPKGFAEGLSFAHTIDNAGPQSVSQTIDVYRHLQAEYPAAKIVASTLDDYAAILWQKRDTFPVVELELGDSWIHGVATDPTKVAQFLALQRLFDGYAGEELTTARRAFGRGLAMVPEHTWGVDIKTYLRDATAWDRPKFEAARRTDPRFAYTEASWAEQRGYLDSAIQKLDRADRASAVAAVAELVPLAAEGEERALQPSYQLAGWTIDIDPVTGDLVRVAAPDGTTLDGEGGSLLGFRYESYDTHDVDLHMDTYLSQRPEWAYFDHAKPGLDKSVTARSAKWTPRATKVLVGNGTLIVEAEMPAEAVAQLGAPRQIEIAIRPDGDGLALALTLRDKPANRMPEASFVTFTPVHATDWQFLKMGLWQDAAAVAPRGGGQLQAVFGVRASTPGLALEITPLDTPLVAPADTPFMSFSKVPPAFPHGVRFNVHNNKWGTNFPMWFEGDFTSRFSLRFHRDVT